jgi:hypothetical protein
MSLYATLDDVKAEMLAENTVDDDKIMRGIRQVSRRIDRLFQSRVALFVPYIETRQIALAGANVSSWNRSLFLRTYQGGISPLLSLTGAAVNSNTLVVGSTVQVYPASGSPYYQIQLLGDAYASWYTYATCSDAWGVQNAAITGVWGYNADYANAWLAVDTLAAAIITTTATTLTVANVDGDNPYGESPRISAGNVIQIDSEWMDVIATDIITNTVTVIRGVNGSTAATHLISAPVAVYQVDEAIRRAVVRQVAFQYARQGAFDTVRISDFSTVTFPKDILDEVNNLLGLFANM